MMLVRCSLPHHEDRERSCVWVPRDESWQEPPTVCNDHPQPDQTEHKNKNDSLCGLNFLSFSSQLSNMSQNSTPNLVYKRKKIRKKALPPNRSSTLTFVYKRKKVKKTESKSGSVDRAPLGDELIEENPKSKIRKSSNLDSCSSSKSNLDVGECSTSGVVIIEGSKSSCLSFLKKHGVLEKRRISKKVTVIGKKTCSRACKVCDRLTTTLKMLICDLCEESFHMSCCNPVIKKVPVGDWFCHFCSRKKLKKIETNSRKSMLRDDNRYASSIRIGEDFQADVPDWSGPLTDELNDYIEPMKISPSECASYQDWDSSKLSKLGSIGNWIQCREVVDDIDGTICGKWRRAPLFEVQTDNWECFSSVLWDPTHADCAVPQELDSDQVLKQLKYIEMLRPRLSAKRWKLRPKKGVDQREHSVDPRNRQSS